MDSRLIISLLVWLLFLYSPVLRLDLVTAARRIKQFVQRIVKGTFRPYLAVLMLIGLSACSNPAPHTVNISQQPPAGRYQYDSYIREASRRYKVDPALIRAIIDTESGGNARAVSYKGALGLMQILPSTAASEFGVHDSRKLLDARTNIDLGTRYFSLQLRAFNGDVPTALAAYNAGPGRVRRSRQLPAETRAYVPRVLQRWRNYHGL